MRTNAGLSVDQLASAVGYNPKMLVLLEAERGLVAGRMPRKILRYLISINAHERTVIGTLSGREVCRKVPIAWDFACGAATRKGTPCRLTVTYKNGRCKLHGGLATGAKTEEGKERIREAQRRRRDRERLAVTR